MRLQLCALSAACAVALIWTFAARERAHEATSSTGVQEAHSSSVREERPAAQDEPARLASTRELAIASTDDDAPETAQQEPASDARVLARAVTEAAQPIADAWLRVRHAARDSAQSGTDGRLALVLPAAEWMRPSELDAWRRIEIEIGAPGHRTRFLRPALAEGLDVVELGDVVLPPGGALLGRVIDESGLGIEGALVVFGQPVDAKPGDPEVSRRGPPDLDPEPFRHEEPALTSTSGAGGAFRLDGLPVGHGTAWARTETSLWSFSPPIGVRAGEVVSGLELVVRDASDLVISGEVVDPDGEPLPGLALTFRDTGTEGSWWRSRTDVHGRFHVVPTGETPKDIDVPSPSWEWEDQKRTAVPAGTHGLRIAFERSSWFTVVVRDERGEAVRNGRAVGLPGSGPTDQALPRSESPLDEDGRAKLRRPDSPLRVRVQAAGYRDALLGPFDPARFPDRLLVTLEPVPALVGRVLLPDGQPAAGASVGLHRGLVSGSGSQPPGSEAAVEQYFLTHQGWPGDRDAFVYALFVEPTARVVADDEGRFRLPLPGVDASAEGEVEREEKDPFGSMGYAGGDASGQLAASTPDESWYVHAALEGHATLTSGPHWFVPTSDFELELYLPPDGAVAGQLLVENGASPAGWSVRASDGLAEIANARVHEDGSFRLEHLHAGAWQVRAFEPGSRFSAIWGRMLTERQPEPDVLVLANRTTEYVHETRERASARLRGRLWVDGRPPGAWRVIVSTAAPHAWVSSHSTTLDPDGRFEVALEPELPTFLSIDGSIDDTSLHISAKPSIVAGDNDWAFDLETARLEGSLPLTSAPNPFLGGPTCVAERGPVRIQVSLDVDEAGRFGPTAVPAGRSALLGPRQNPRDPPPTWAELDLAPGEKRTIELR